MHRRVKRRSDRDRRARLLLHPPALCRAIIPVVTVPSERPAGPSLPCGPSCPREAEQGATSDGALLPALRGLDDDSARFYYVLVYISQ
jgi:hypothetical protein